MALAGLDMGLRTEDFGVAVVDTGSSGFSMPSAVLRTLSNFLNAVPDYSALFGADFLMGSTCVTTPGVTSDQLNDRLPRLDMFFAGVAMQLRVRVCVCVHFGGPVGVLAGRAEAAATTTQPARDDLAGSPVVHRGAGRSVRPHLLLLRRLLAERDADHSR